MAKAKTAKGKGGRKGTAPKKAVVKPAAKVNHPTKPEAGSKVSPSESTAVGSK